MPLELVEHAKYLGMTINSDISWDFHVQRLCQNMYYHLSLLRRLRRIFPRDLLLQAYKSYVQPRLDYGITLYGCSTQNNIDLIQRVQNHAARLITGNFDYINCRGIELVKSLNPYTIRDRRDYFLTILIFKYIHGIAPTYLSDRFVMNFDVNGYDTRGSDMESYLPRCVKSLIGTVSCIWVANCGMIYPSLYKILHTLNHSNVIIKCPNCLLTPDWFNSFLLVFTICQVLCDEMIVPYFLSSSLCTLMWMDFCISYCIDHTELCFSFL